MIKHFLTIAMITLSASALDDAYLLEVSKQVKTYDSSELNPTVNIHKAQKVLVQNLQEPFPRKYQNPVISKFLKRKRLNPSIIPIQSLLINSKFLKRNKNSST